MILNAFILVLSFSRHMFVAVVRRMDAATWLDCHVRAFAFFGAVPSRIILDNLKSGVLHPDLYDPLLNRGYAELARHFGCLIDQVRKPKDNLGSSGKFRTSGRAFGRVARLAVCRRLTPVRSGGACGWLVPETTARRGRRRCCCSWRLSSRQRTDSSHVLAAVRALNRLELVRETFRHTLDVLASAVPSWMLAHARQEWVERYEGRTDEVRLPKSKEGQQQLADTIGGDGQALLAAAYAVDAPPWLREVPAVDTLRRVWLQNYLPTEAGVRWRTTDDGIPKASQFLSSPFDLDAHLGRKNTTGWVGYKVHLTETCEDNAPNLITHVETTAAPMADGEVTPRVHRALQEQRLLPQIHIVDTGYLDAELLVTTDAEYGVQLLGPTRHDHRWQTRAAAGFGAEHFRIDWERREAICPQGADQQ
jgi:Integrase core domain